MRTLTTAGGTAAALIALGLALAGCGSDAKPAASSSSASPSTSGAATSTAPAKSLTLADYIKDNGITETAIHRGDPGAPVLDLPVPDGWADVSAQAPDYAYGAMIYTDPAMASRPPSVTTIMSRLTGNVDQAKVFDAAPGELKNLPGFEGMGDGNGVKFAGFDAYQIGGSYVRDGVKRMIAQKTVFIPAKEGDGAFILQFNADGTEDQIAPLMDGTAQIDAKATITMP